MADKEIYYRTTKNGIEYAMYNSDGSPFISEDLEEMRNNYYKEYCNGISCPDSIPIYFIEAPSKMLTYCIIAFVWIGIILITL